MTESHSLLESVLPDAAVADDPYDLRLIAQRMLEQLADGDHEGARQRMQLLRRLRGKLPALTLLEQAVLDGGRTLSRHGSVYFLGPQNASPTFIRDVNDAVACAAELLGEPPAVLINFNARPQLIYLTHREFPGFAVITVSTHSRRFPDRLRRTLFHEVAHAFLSSGSRLLDEGFAIWFAEKHAGVPTRRSEGETAAPPSLRALLLNAGNEGLLFENTGLDPEEITALRRVAADLVGELIGRVQLSGLRSLFAEIEHAAPGERVVALVEHTLGRRIEDTGASPAAASDTSDAESALEALRAIMGAWRRRDRSGLADIAQRLEARPPRSAALLDALVNLRITDAAVAATNGVRPEEQLLVAIDTALSEAASAGLSPGRLFTLRAKRADLGVLVAQSNPVKMANATQQALHWYTKALAETPGDPELLVFYGIHEAHVPEKYGGGRAKAIALIGRAVEDPLWGEWARDLIKDFDAEINPATRQPAAAARKSAAPTPPSASPENPTKRVAAPPAVPVDARPVLVASRSLLVRVGEEFELAPSDLSIRAGERVALVGHNGAGKSVFIDALLGLRKTTSGSISLLSRDPGALRARPEERRGIGAFLQNINFPPLIRVKEILRTHATIYQTQNPALRTVLGLDELVDKEFKTLSKGQKQRVKLFLALAHRPKVVLLDEPTLGLDERYARALRDYWTGPELRQTALLFASHIPADIATSDRVVCLAAGKVIDEGPIQALIARHVGQFRGHVSQTLAVSAMEDLARLEGLIRPPVADERGVTIHGRAGFDRAFISFLERYAIAAFSLEPSSAEDFLAHLALSEK